jgi:hypothetical protein
MHIKVLLSIIIIFFGQLLNSQIVPGEWREHMPYHNGQKIVMDGNKVYCMTPNSLFYYDKSDNSINKISKIQGLTECEFSDIAFSSKSKTLIIAYNNSNIDLIKNNKITNIPYIKNKITIPDKRINSITVIDSLAYISCAFGITVLDLDKQEIKDTYYPSTNGQPNIVNDICFDDKFIYAATQNGIFKALKADPFLVDYSKWSQFTNFKNYGSNCMNVEYTNNKLYALYGDPSEWVIDTITFFNGNIWRSIPFFSWNIRSIQAKNNTLICSGDKGMYILDENNSSKLMASYPNPNYGIEDESGTFWMADPTKALIRAQKNGDIDAITPNSPLNTGIVKMDIKHGQLWAVSGGRDGNYGGLEIRNGPETFIDNKWTSYPYDTLPDHESGHFRDLIDVVIDPNDPERVYMTAWTNGGLVEYNHGAFHGYDERNSPLLINQLWAFPGVNVSSLAIDKNNYVWLANSITERPLAVFNPNGQNSINDWKSYSLGKSSELAKVGRGMVATSWGHIWVVKGRYSTSIYIYNPNNTPLNPDDDTEPYELTLANVKSITAPIQNYCIAEDLKQNIWVGTDAGPVYFSSPLDPYNTENPIIGSKILIPVAKGEERAAYVLETERINDIAIDGNNRKWIATHSSGAFLLSEDGATQIYNFTAEKDPLPSNTILDIAIDGKSGEVFFATDKGLVSYRGQATEGGINFGKVYAYPNPVRPDYTGDIFITGLLTDANVRITDISGNLVYETNALGGQAVWNGRNLLNKRVNTGVYLIFCSNKDGSKTAVTKLMFIH